MQILDKVRHKFAKEGLFGVLRAAGQPLLRRPAPMEQALEQLASFPSITIVQVGAFIGDTDNDPLFKFIHRYAREFQDRGKPFVAVLVEPVKEYFDVLTRNYESCPNVCFENVAIAEERGVRDFHRLSVDPVQFGYPAWLKEVGSLKSDRIGGLWDACEHELLEMERALDYKAFLAKYTIIEKVQCVALDDVFDKHHLTAIHLLQIDAEGYDYEILKTIDFDRWAPKFVSYERIHLHEQEGPCRAMMKRAGYLLRDYAFLKGRLQDTLCVLKERRKRK